jgi:hypothetical protein
MVSRRNLKFEVVFVPLAAIIRTMKRGGRAELYMLMGVLLSMPAMAVTDTPYNAIIERNVFNLHAPPPPVNPADLIKEIPPPKITLTGITTILGQKKTFLTIPPNRPGAAPESLMLAEGQGENQVEVKRIDEKAGVVEVINHGHPQTLDFENNGVKPSGAPQGAPQTMAMPVPAAPPPNVVPMPPPANVIRPLRSLAPRSNPVSENNNNNGFGGGVSSGVNPQGQQNTLTPEEQVALIEIQRIKYRQENNPISTILPTTELTPEVNGNPAPQ